MNRIRSVLTSTLIVAVVAAPLSTSYALFDKTRFVLHLGAAYFAFHHWDLAPFQQGRFSAAAPPVWSRVGWRWRSPRMR